MNAQFKVGDTVTATSFVDCFGKHVPERNNLTVTAVRLIECSSIPAYYRVEAHSECGMVEAAERFFVRAEVR